MTEQLTIDKRFRGPPESANGGYAAGTLGGFIDGPTQVTLWLPPPLGRPLDVVRENDHFILRDGDSTVAEAVAAELKLPVPPPPSPDEAKRASEHSPVFRYHPFPGCFVCGPDRKQGDALRIFPGPARRPTVMAAPWQPDCSLADSEGVVRPEYIWAALDCTGGFAVTNFERQVSVLGRITVKLMAQVTAGEQYVVQGWPLETTGRKRFAGTALHAEDGTVCAVAQAVWIDLA